MKNVHRTYVSINDALPDLARHVLAGDEVGSRLGERVLEQLHQTITLAEPWRRYCLVPGRKANVAAQIAETMWVLSGRDDVEWLANYLPRAKDFSDDGRTWRGAYGPRLRSWGQQTDAARWQHVDQLAHVLQLLREDPTTRRAVIQIYDPSADALPGKDVPCNNWISFQSRLGLLHMHVAIRSNDLFWGWSGINAFEWSALQEILAGMLGIGVGQITFSISSLHAYDRHWKRLRSLGEVTSHPELAAGNGAFDAPRFADDKGVAGMPITALDAELARWMDAEQAMRQAPDFAAAGRVVDGYHGNPMFHSWLAVLAIWWHGADPSELVSTTLQQALQHSPQRKRPDQQAPAAQHGQQGRAMDAWRDYVETVVKLHETKHAAYGDSWKRRGEQLGILANVARKADRLGATDEYETALDTAVDLFVYLVKYHLWLEDQCDGTSYSDGHEKVGERLRIRLLDAAYGGSPRTPAQEQATMINRNLERAPFATVWADYTLQGKLGAINQLAGQAAQLVLATWAEGQQR